MTFKPARVIALSAALIVAACGEDSLVPSDLSQDEAQELASAILSATFANSGTIPTGPQLSGPQMVEFMTTFDDTAPCPMGGEVALSGSLDVYVNDTTQAAELTYVMTQVHDGCVVQGDGGRQFTLTGNPNLGFNFLVSTEGESVTWDGTVAGTLDWVHDGNSGSCGISYEFSGTAQAGQSIGGSVEGTVCGYQIDREFSLSSG